MSSTLKLRSWLKALPRSFRVDLQAQKNLDLICANANWKKIEIPATFLTYMNLLEAFKMSGGSLEGGVNVSAKETIVNTWLNDNPSKERSVEFSSSLAIWSSPQSQHDDYHELVKELKGASYAMLSQNEKSYWLREFINFVDAPTFKKFSIENDVSSVFGLLGLAVFSNRIVKGEKELLDLFVDFNVEPEIAENSLSISCNFNKKDKDKIIKLFREKLISRNLSTSISTQPKLRF